MIKLKHFRQKRPGFCGPVSLKMILDYCGVSVSITELAKLSGTTKEKGTSMEGLIRAVKRFGLYVFFKENGTLDDIRYFIKKKIPVIVDWFLEDEGHYSVVVNITKSHIFLLDPTLSKILIYTRKRKMSLKKFLRVWFDFPGKLIKEPKDLILRSMMVATPLKESFAISGKYR